MVENPSKPDDAKADKKVADSKVIESRASASIYDEVNKDREQGKPRPTSDTSASETAVSKHFGSLQIIGDDTARSAVAVNKLSTDGKGLPTTGATPDAADQAAAKSAKEIDDGLHWYKADEYGKINRTLEGKKPEEIAAIDREFQKTHDGHTVKQVLNERWGGKHDDKLKETEALLSPKDTPKDTPAEPATPAESSDDVKAKESQAKSEALDSIKKDPEIAKKA
jgi:hypothetical protein